MAIQHKKPNQTIKDELKKRHISQVQAAFDLDINRIAFNQIANGWDIPGPVTRIKICEYLDKPESVLFPDA